MNRQVNIKALISHVVNGDGMNKCRICMGDTSEGLVHLSDTVMLDGEKPITLSELLEIITGVKVPIQEDMPHGLCSTCSVSILTAADFRVLCRKAVSQWETTIELLDSLPLIFNKDRQTLLVFIQDNEMTIVDDDTEKSDKAVVDLKADVVKCRCPNCGKAFQYPHQLYHHLKKSTDLTRACYICAKIMSRDELLLHLGENHDKRVYDCKKCPTLLTSLAQYIQHMKTAHAEGLCTCGECGQNFQTQNAYHAHLSIHSLKKCPRCDVIFRNRMCYLHHIKQCCKMDSSENTIKVRNKTYVQVNSPKSKRKLIGLRGSTKKTCICDYCHKKFAGKKFVRAHIEIVHMKNTHRPCVYCGKLLAAAYMSAHVKTHKENSYKCEHCGLILKSRLGYTQHLRLHTGEKPYTCKECGETFSASSRRSEHMQKVHKKREVTLKYTCELCPARFNLPYKLKKHIASAHSTEDSSAFECEVCHVKFMSCRGLLHHSRTHQQVAVQRKMKRDVRFNAYDAAHERKDSVTDEGLKDDVVDKEL